MSPLVRVARGGASAPCSGAFAQQAEELPTDGHQALADEFNLVSDRWVNHLRNGVDQTDPAKPDDQHTVDAAAKWATYRLTWGLEKDPGKLNDLLLAISAKTFRAIRGSGSGARDAESG